MSDDDLFSPLELRGTEIRNRVMVSPMCQYSAEDGYAQEWHRQHLESRATGGAGLVMAEATAVEARGRISPQDLGIWTDDHTERLRPIVEFMRSQGATTGIQLAHAGRKASTSRPWEGSDPLQPDEGGWEVIAPSDKPWPYEDVPPVTRKMDHEDIAAVQESFVAAAERARDVGFDVAEIHAAHGYLIHEFLSPVTNERDDEYGGSFENRARFCLEVVEKVREVWPDDQPLFVRISGTDWLPDRESWTIEQSARLAEAFAERGVDLVDVSSGAVHPAQQIPHTGANYQVRLAEAVRETGIPVGAVGKITTAQQADALVRNDRADLAVVGREHLRDPYFTLHAAEELGATDRVDWPVQYRRAK
ncbi:MAG: NADH:flavin oxidoreductase/NADH oxidase [Haloarculaceae archaeon]